jgi:zinc protease
MRTGLWKWLVIPALLLAATAHAATFEKTLGNGLKVIVKEDHRSPVAVQQVWYRVGSMDEWTGKTGVAHALEHMMFKGTRSVPAGEFSKRIAAAGGRENAFTSYDYTAYFQMLHKSKLPLAMQLESDRMQNLLVPKKEFSKEIQVVMEERRWRTDDSPHSLLSEQLMATMFEQHPYHHPVIGWMSDLKRLTADDVRAWYRRWYRPNNAVLVVAGDVDPKKVFALAQHYYGHIPRRPIPETPDYTEPAQQGVKRIVVKAPAELPYMIMAYHAPALHRPSDQWKPYALEVLAGVLDGNGAARLNQSLVREQQLASDVGADYDPLSRGPDVFMLEGTPSEGKTTADLETGFRKQIDKLIRDGVSEDELKRVKAQITASHVYQRDSVFYQAMEIGQLESLDLSWKDIPLMLQKLQAVTAKQVQDVAKEVFTDDNLTVAVLDPQPLKKNQRLMPEGGANVR